ncbi:MAG: PRD domain-containing protein, partial [Erysipelotrichaceae bacterium]|nr:PRD domain-containing protein [Erysipelotrichaceae bacterium]
FGMKVYGVSPHKTQADVADYIELDTLENIAPKVDILTGHLKDRPDTEKLIGEKIKEKYGYQIEENEYTYLTIHIARLLR